MDQWIERDVAANGIRLHIARTGGDGPPVVLAHGVTDDGRCWTPLAEVLAADHDVVMVDARGHGRSDVPETGYDPATQAADLAGVVTALGLRRPAVLGHSMGAATALVMAGTTPDLPGAILLEDPPPWWLGSFRASRRTVDLDERCRQIMERKDLGRDALIAAQRTEAPGWAEAELAPWAEAKLRVSPCVVEVFDPANPTRVDWPAVLGRVACPVLLITSDPELGGLVTPEAADALRAHILHLRVANIPGAGHNIRRDQPEPCLAAVRTFLADVTPA